MKVLLYLLRRCYGVIYRLLSSSEPVSEELMPIVTVFIIFCRSHELIRILITGKQTLDSEKMPERGAQIWWTVQPARFIPRTCHISPIAGWSYTDIHTSARTSVAV